MILISFPFIQFPKHLSYLRKMEKRIIYLIFCEIITTEFFTSVQAQKVIQTELLIINQNNTIVEFDSVTLSRDGASTWDVDDLPPRYKIGHDDNLQLSSCSQITDKSLICIDADHRIMYRILPLDENTNNTSMMSRIGNGISMAFKVVYDDLHDVVYWYDAYFNKLAMASLDRPHVPSYAILQMAGIGDFCVAPRKGLVFYSKERQGRSAIWRSTMLGEKIYTVVYRGIEQPRALNVDEIEQRIYWHDAVKMTIEYSDFNGDGRHVIIASVAPYRGLQVLTGNTILAFSFKSIEAIEFSSENSKVEVLIDDTALDSIVLIHNKSESNGISCQNLRCEHYCVTHDGTEKCVCTKGYILHPDKQRCLAPTGYIDRLVYTITDGKLCVNNLTVLAGLNERPSCFEEYKNVTFLSHDRIKRNLYFTSVSNGQCALFNFHVDTKKGNRTLFISSSVKGIVKDSINDVLYIIMGQSLIAFNSTTQLVIRNDIINASHLVYSEDNELLLWYSQHKGIDVCSPHKGNVSRLVAALNVQSMVYNNFNNRLYWTTDDGMWSILVQGTGFRVETVLDHYTIILGIYQDLFYLRSERDNITLIAYNWSKRKFLYNLAFSANSTVDGMIILDSDTLSKRTENCLTNNGNCQHICYLDDNGNESCTCETGFQLGEDMHSCVRDVQEEAFVLVADTGSKSIYQIGTVTNNVTSVLENSSVIDFDLDPHSMDIFFSTANDSYLSTVNINSAEISKIPLNGVFPRRLSYDNVRQTVVFSAFSGKTTNLYVINATDAANMIKLDDNVNALSIALHIGNGYVFTTTIVPEPRISQYDYVNMEKKELSIPHLQSPTGLAVDEEREDIYWVDLKSYTCYKSKMTATPQVSTVYYSQEFMPKDIALDERFMYIMGNNGRYILQLSKSPDGSKEIIPISPLMGFLGPLRVYHKEYCPSVIDGGEFKNNCTFRPNTVCTYYCNTDKNETNTKNDTGWITRCSAFTKQWFMEDSGQLLTRSVCRDISTTTESTTQAPVNGSLANGAKGVNSSNTGNDDNSRINGPAIALGILLAVTLCGLIISLVQLRRKRKQKYHGIIVDKGIKVNNDAYGGEKEI